ncbi:MULTISPECIES: hypothetical protein [unclassified Nocardia]|uniref:hypothetical protein n=1 Tax=unclassified Nocardia TaxID=2637762 RepID=UPI0033BA7AED
MFGPESFLATLAGFACISLPYLDMTFRQAWWLIVLPPVVGIIALALGGDASPLRLSLQRVGVGLLVAFAGFVPSVAGLLGAIGIASLV